MRGSKKIRLVVDTNIWISFLISKKLVRLITVWLSDAVQILFSEELVTELLSVVERPKYQKYFNRAKIDELFSLIRHTAEFIHVADDVKMCRDPKDDFLLALCQSGDADYLVTGDKDLLEIEKFGETCIVTVSEFETIFNTGV